MIALEHLRYERGTRGACIGQHSPVRRVLLLPVGAASAVPALQIESRRTQC